MLERTAFVLLFAASVAYFVRVVYRRFHHPIQRVPPLCWDHPGERLWRVFCEVLLQTRVIRERPVTGLLHALVMWGFFVFAWVSAEHLSLGLWGLDGARPSDSWYGVFAAAWAVAVIVGILGLAFRRFVLRPAELGPLSGTSAVVAALIARRAELRRV